MHRGRRRQIASDHPEVRALFRHDVRTVWVTLAGVRRCRHDSVALVCNGHPRDHARSRRAQATSLTTGCLACAARTPTCRCLPRYTVELRDERRDGPPTQDRTLPSNPRPGASGGGVVKAPRYRAPGVLGNVRGMRSDPLGFLQAAAAACGPVARFRLGPYLGHLISGPDQVHRVLVDSEHHYDRNTRQFAAIGLGLGQSLLTTSADSWRVRRRMVQPAFHRDRIDGLCARMADTITSELDGWTGARTHASVARWRCR